MPTYRMLIEYDGSDFCGWQIQKQAETVQQSIQEALRVALREDVDIVGSGRTDTGVHARGQVAHFVLSEPCNSSHLRAALNGILPPSIAVSRLDQTRDDFHARYDAVSRTYRYFVSTIPFAIDRTFRVKIRAATDFDLMNRACETLVGRHDFSSFCRTQSATRNRVCTVAHAQWHEEPSEGHWHFEISADRFLHGMVRAIVGTLLQVGYGKRDSDEIATILDKRDRRHAGPAAPAQGLVLEHVTYPDDT